MSKDISTNFTLDECHQNISELWESLAVLAQRRVNDNAKGNIYPLETRRTQLSSAQALLKCIADTHTKMDKE